MERIHQLFQACRPPRAPASRRARAVHVRRGQGTGRARPGRSRTVAQNIVLIVPTVHPPAVSPCRAGPRPRTIPRPEDRPHGRRIVRGPPAGPAPPRSMEGPRRRWYAGVRTRPACVPWAAGRRLSGGGLAAVSAARRRPPRYRPAASPSSWAASTISSTSRSCTPSDTCQPPRRLKAVPAKRKMSSLSDCFARLRTSW